MAKKGFLKPAQALAAALAAVSAASGAAAYSDMQVVSSRVEVLEHVLKSEEPFGKTQFIIERASDVEAGRSLAYHSSHSSHSSHRSHSSHSSHYSSR